jgi:hypothetical protein
MKIKDRSVRVTNTDWKFRLLLLILLGFSSSIVKSQDPFLRVYPSFSISAGYVNPESVNNYIDNNINSLKITDVIGSRKIILYYEVNGGLTFRMRFFDITGFAEYATAPKWFIITNGDNLTYFLNRSTFGATGKLYLRLGMGKSALFLGGGLNYNIMTFENYRATTPGYRILAGASMQFGRFNLQPFLAYNHPKVAKVGPNLELDYTGYQIGINLSFHKRMLY